MLPSFFISFRDPHKLEVYSVEYVVDNGSIAFAVTDADKNLILYTHQVFFLFISLQRSLVFFFNFGIKK